MESTHTNAEITKRLQLSYAIDQHVSGLDWGRKMPMKFKEVLYNKYFTLRNDYKTGDYNPSQ